MALSRQGLSRGALFFLLIWAGLAPATDPNGDAAVDYSQVLPEAVRFEQAPDAAYVQGFDAQGNSVGWAVVSTEVTDAVGYSGKPMVTLVGLDSEARITKAQVLSHSEPILLVGIPEQELHAFVDNYAGLKAEAAVVVGRSDSPDVVQIDGISGATVTVLAQNQTIQDAARSLGAAVGILEAGGLLPGHFSEEETPLSWDQMRRKGVLGRLHVSGADMGDASIDDFVDLYFTIADAPSVGRALMAPGDYNWLKKNLKEDEHILVVMGNGASSFKGSGFVRGGMFDRIRLEQKLNVFFFRDVDHHPLSEIPAQGAPTFNEASAFIIRGKFDPGRTASFVFLGSRYDGKGAFSREFRAFRTDFRLPRSVYQLDVPDPETQIQRQAWAAKKGESMLLGGYLLLVMGVFAARRWMTGSMKRLQILHTSSMLFGLIVVGFVLGAQPSITQVLTLVGKLKDGEGFSLFLTEPLIFVFWIFIAVVTIAWGRGVFCGWVCPYGALSELTFKLGRKLGLPEYELSDKRHKVLRLLRYGILAGLIPVFLVSPELGERLAEIEPFKTTFFLIPWTRSWLFFGWWLVLLVWSGMTFRPFCRYICPLGAALALPGSLRISGPRRRNFCASCQICTRGCEPRAIRPDGTIDPRECLSCMECEANFYDDKTCPPLIGLSKLPPLEQMTAKEKEKHARLTEGAFPV